MQMALRGGAAGVASNLAGGQDMFTGRGLSEGYGTLSPLDIGKRTLGMDKNYNEPQGLDYFKKNFKNPFAKTLSPEDGALKLKYQAALDADDPLKAKAYRDLISGGGGGGRFGMGDIFTKGLLPTFALAQLIKRGQPEGDDTPEKTNRTIDDMIFQDGDKSYDYRNYFAKGGVMDLQDGGESKGPGTGTSDSIPAMLSDGEFVMTADAVRGAGGGDRREGARKMYEAMDQLEARA